MKRDPDLTREELLAELAALRERLRLAGEAARQPDGVQEAVLADLTEVISRFTPDGTFLYVNDAFCRFFGKSHEELIGNTWRPRALPEDVPLIEEKLAQLSPDNPVVVIENRVLDAAGNVRWMQFVNRAFSGAAGGIREIQSVGRDITDRREAEEALRESEERLELVMRGSQLGFWDWNLETGEVRRNERWASMLGYTLDDIVFTVKQWADFLHPDDVAGAWRSIQDHLEGRTPMHRAEYRMRTKGGDHRWILDQATIVKRDGQGKPLRMSGTHTDITDRREAGEELRLAKEQAEAASRAKSEFLANMSHEIRTPLNGLLGVLQVLKFSPLTPDQTGLLDMAERSGQRLTALLGDILDLSRIEAGRMTLRQEPLSIMGLLEAIRETFEPACLQKDLSLEIMANPGTPDVVIGDEVRLRQVLFNFVGNAVKFTESGSITVEAYCAPPAAGEEARLVFEVRDTGVGIPEGKLESVFEPFTQAAGTRARDSQGAGLGLTISRRLVRLMGGSMTLDSRAGEGTGVSMTIPVEFAPEITASVQAPASEAGAGGATWSILLAEDDPVSRMVVKRLLEISGCRVTAVGDGERALEALALEPFDCVLMDVQMPVLDGLETVRRIRAEDQGRFDPGIPVLALTAYAMAGDRDACLSAGMDGYVSKPVEIRALMAAIGKTLAGAGGYPAREPSKDSIPN